jgi:nicotinamidase-related amidase
MALSNLYEETMMTSEKTALILIGYQNDYFAPDGILHAVIEESSRVMLKAH